MKIGEVLKELKPSERLKALVIIMIVTSITSLLTIWLRGNDCIDISNQYNSLIKNHSNLMKANNNLIEENTKNIEVISKLDSMLREIRLEELKQENEFLTFSKYDTNTIASTNTFVTNSPNGPNKTNRQMNLINKALKIIKRK